VPNVEELRSRVSEHVFWWHSIDLGDGVVTPGHKPVQVLEEELSALRLPDLQGKTVLDLGAWDGFFSFAAERLGASRVVALDYYTWATDPAILRHGAGAQSPLPWDPIRLPGKRGFDLVRETLHSGVESVFGDLLDIDIADLGTFDIVLVLGVLYHSRYPVEMLEKVASLTRETMVLETESFVIPGYEDASLGQFFETDELADNESNWWSLTEPAIVGMCRSSGFARVDLLPPYHRALPEPNGLTRHRALVHAQK
jgi:tRNA (mo5U34)-methyltransferase